MRCFGAETNETRFHIKWINTSDTGYPEKKVLCFKVKNWNLIQQDARCHGRTHYRGNIILASGNQKYPMSQTTWSTSSHMAYFTMSWETLTMCWETWCSFDLRCGSIDVSHWRNGALMKRCLYCGWVEVAPFRPWETSIDWSFSIMLRQIPLSCLE